MPSWNQWGSDCSDPLQGRGEMQARGRTGSTHSPVLHLASLFLPMMYPTLSALPWPDSVPSVMFSPLSALWVALVIHFPEGHLLSHSVGPTPGHDSDCYVSHLPTHTQPLPLMRSLCSEILNGFPWLITSTSQRFHGAKALSPTSSLSPFLRFSSSWAGEPEMSEYLTIKYQMQIWKIIIMTTTIIGVLSISYILPHLTDRLTKNS